MGSKRKLSEASSAPVSHGVNDEPASPVMPEAPTEPKDRRFQNLYAKPPDFKQLARCDPEFAAVTKGRELDFGDPAAVMQLTKTLLKLDFGLTIQLPPDRLCPPVPNRHSYVLWLKSLLDTSSYGPPGQKLLGLDIGTGASCIYPLLGCAQRPWSFIATDIDPESVQWARKNVELNELGHRIRVVERKPEDSLVPLDELGVDSIDFAMTNPPFYGSEDDMLRSARQKAQPPWTACTGSRTEMVVEGGEVAFVERIVGESLVLRRRVRWYSAMLGFLSSVRGLVDRLRGHGIRNYAVAELVQGNKTRRWAVAWSFGPMRPAQAVARATKAASSKHDLLPAATEARLTAPLPAWPDGVGAFAGRLSRAVGALDLISWDWDAQALEGTGRAADKVWARAWRRRRKRREAEAKPAAGGREEPACVFGFRVKMHVGPTEASVSCRWLEGLDGTVFESFQGFLQAAVARSASPDEGVEERAGASG